MKQILTLIALMLLAAIIFLVTSGDEANNTNQPNFKSYQSGFNSGYEYSFDYPQTAEVEGEANRTKVTYAGPNNDAPALTDGFLWSMGLINFDDISELTAGSIGEVNEGIYNDKPSYSFSTTNELGGESNYYIIQLDDNTAAEIIYTITGNNDADYQNLIDQMNQSIVLTPADSQNSDNGAVTVDQVDLALLQDPTGSPDRGCDDVIMVTRNIEPTTAPLNAAISALFDISDTTIEGYGHFIPNTADTLSFDRAEIVDGEAQIYLDGELSGLAGVCDNPRAAIQIEETALQFNTVNSVQIYLNDQPTDLIPSLQN